jgi:hypothetical protein
MKKTFKIKEDIKIEALNILLEAGDEITVDDKKDDGKKDIPSLIFEFFSQNPNPKDTAVQQFAENLKIDEHKLEEEIYKLLSTFISGGKSVEQGFDKEVDEEQLKMGMEVELEHVNKESAYAKLIARKIALDHLAEFPDVYYTKLAEIEKEMSTSPVEEESKKESVNIYNSIKHNNNQSFKENTVREDKRNWNNSEMKKLK